ncbi:MAG: glycosyltransferase family 4 protein [Bacteroidia bacterium]|nr:glycosyltransferase family 4 protein [Bacteroidia bacterium]
MNVLHISSEPEWRGGEQQLAYLIDELYKNQVKQSVLCLHNSAMHKYCQTMKIEHYTFKKYFLNTFFIAGQVNKLCVQHKFDLLHLHDSHAHNLGVLAADLFFNNTPMVLSRKVAFPISKNLFSNYKYNHKKIRKIICVSDAVKNVMGRDIRDKTKLLTLYDCVDIKIFAGGKTGLLRRQYAIPNDELIIGNIAALTPEKDHRTFIYCAEKFINAGLPAKFIIVGTGSDKNKLKKIVEEKNLSTKIIFHGFADDVAPVIRDLDLFLFTSSKEGMGSILLAAFAAGIPVVSTDCGGIPELVKNNETGLLAPVGDTSKLFENILKLTQNNELKEKIISNAYAFVQNFSKEKMAKQVLDVYCSL